MKTAAIASQLCFAAAGLLLVWRLLFSPEARRSPAPARLPPWSVALPDALSFFLHGVTGGFLGSFLIGVFAKPLGLHGDALAISATAALHFGALAGFLFFLHRNPACAPVFGPLGAALRTGLATFLIAMPFVSTVNLVWLQLLKALGYDLARQPAVEMVDRLGTSPWLALFLLFAVAVAPAMEELLFRGGLYRVLRTRLRPWLALALPSLLFAAIHLHLPSYLPLAALGVIFSLAYARTGMLGTAIVAHGAFNLNNLFVLLSGAGE